MRYNQHAVVEILRRKGIEPTGYHHKFIQYVLDPAHPDKVTLLLKPRKPNTLYSTYQWNQIKKRFGLTPEDLHAPER